MPPSPEPRTDAPPNRARVRDRVIRSVSYRLHPDVRRDPLTTDGRVVYTFQPDRVTLRYDQDGLVAAPGAWDVQVEVSGPRILRDNSLGVERKSRIYQNSGWPSWTDKIVRAFHPDTPGSVHALRGVTP